MKKWVMNVTPDFIAAKRLHFVMELGSLLANGLDETTYRYHVLNMA